VTDTTHEVTNERTNGRTDEETRRSRGHAARLPQIANYI